MSVERGLAAAGLCKVLHRTLEHHIRQRKAERGICLLEKTTNFEEGLGEVLAHADFLSALTGEEENSGERHGVRERW
jgi:hypothetical protein